MGFDVGGVVLSSASGALSVDAASNWMKVDINGILTRPQTPYMRGQITGQTTPYNAGGGPLLIIADVNLGNCWNNATGYWTCPVAGYYLVIFGNIAGGSTATSGYLNIRKNGGIQDNNHWNHSGTWHYMSHSSIVSCAASDTISWVLTSYSPATTGFYAAGGHGMHSIALLA